MKTFKLIVCAALLFVAQGCLYAAQEVKPLFNFESEDDLKTWESDGPLKLTSEHLTQGGKTLLVQPGKFIKVARPQDWSGFESLDIDCFVEGDDPVSVTVIVFDKLTETKRSYWNWHNGFHTLTPGASTLSLPVDGMFRGEQGCANGDIHCNIKPNEITVFHLGFTTKGNCKGIYLNRMRLTKERPPEGILAFGFGPEQQASFPGFKPISWNSVYGQAGRTAGLKQSCGNANRARDDGFPTRLFQHFVWFQENGNEFITDAPNGKCHVWMVFDDCGFWAGEQAHFHKRSILANGKEVFSEDRGENGPLDYMYRFENVEPRPGDSMWDLYIKELFKPVKFEAEVTDGKLRIQCNADGYWNSKVAAMVVYPDAKKSEGEQWIAEVEQRNKKEFDARAVFLGPKAKELKVPPEAQAKGYWLGFPEIDEQVALVNEPGKADGKLQRTGAKGQRTALTFAVRPLKDFSGPVALTASELKSPSGVIPPSCVDLRYVLHLTKRAPNQTAYSIRPDSLRRVDGSKLQLAKDLTRQFWITVEIPADAKAGIYSGEVSLAAGALKITLPISIEVLNVALDEPDFAFGLFGVHVPPEFTPAKQKTAWLELLTLLHNCGMNSLSGGPSVTFTGLDAQGKPLLDFAACDEHFRLLKQAGFTKPVYTYGGGGGVAGLHDGYEIGATGQGWEKKTGKPFGQILQFVYAAVKEHADKAGWPQVNYSLLDEPRVIEAARRNLDLHKAYHDGAPSVYMGGFYSVNWSDKNPFHTVVQDIFKNMAWSGLNVHEQADLDKAKELGRDIHIYNQGKSRFSFGAYQWAEMRKGVKGRLEWHTLNLAGYQFFDLDGQEPDFGFINWGRNEIIPTLALGQCAEGAADFRIAVTLWNLAEKKKDTSEGKAALEYLEGVNRLIGFGDRKTSQNFSNETFRNTCLEHLKKLLEK
jgi:hypothetical protein